METTRPVVEPVGVEVTRPEAAVEVELVEGTPQEAVVEVVLVGGTPQEAAEEVEDQCTRPLWSQPTTAITSTTPCTMQAPFPRRSSALAVGEAQGRQEPRGGLHPHLPVGGRQP